MKDKGILQRYTITHKDGKPIDPDKEYFVLDMSNPDLREFEALHAFASLCIITGYQFLGLDIFAKILKPGKPELATHFIDHKNIKARWGPFVQREALNILENMNNDDFYLVALL